MSRRKEDPRSRNFEHSRYKDWRPNYNDDSGSGGRRRRDEEWEDRRRGSVLGWLMKLVVSLVVIVVMVALAGDYVNGRLKAAEGSCAVRVILDGDSFVPGCPGGQSLPGEIAGYNAPELLRPGCFAEFTAALLASLDIRKVLYGADRVELRQAGGVTPAPEIVTDADTETETETPPAADAAEVPQPDITQDPTTPVRVLVDGTDLAERMLALGAVQPVGGPGWCE